ncbi:YopX family protein [Lactiplantibacillus plantarum]|uniref:YopX family protein n=1 Tax=Lactiplantibacillus plantarum TaxID=1590 RepID=UPI0021CB6251|nr:YopX family protein [Lactiplantibacillus plantarum]MDT4760817.1 YopX family protein [Lactiplantibacillus plantarum]MDY7131663.1 YopX family protein [Lactiplantibacillus plantarum]
MIKFRVWSRTLGKYRQLDETSNDQGLGMLFEVKDGIGSNVTSICYSVGDVVEQFTGLTDVNGKEIYIGDVVKEWSDMSELTMEPTVNEVVSEDSFGQAGVFLKPLREHFIEPCLHDYWSNQFEVIGNVHENPELLEADTND